MKLFSFREIYSTSYFRWWKNSRRNISLNQRLYINSVHDGIGSRMGPFSQTCLKFRIFGFYNYFCKLINFMTTSKSLGTNLGIIIQDIFSSERSSIGLQPHYLSHSVTLMSEILKCTSSETQIFVFLYLCQFNSDLYETLNLSSCATNRWLPVTTPCLKEAILGSSIYLCQFNSDLYETLNLCSWDTN